MSVTCGYVRWVLGRIALVLTVLALVTLAFRVIKRDRFKSCQPDRNVSPPSRLGGAHSFCM